MKKIILFLPMVILLFMFLPNYKTDAAVIICPFVVGIDPGCDTDPSGEINIPVGNYNTTITEDYYIERGIYNYRIHAPTSGYYHLNLDTHFSPSFDVVIKDSYGNLLLPPTRGGDIDFGELKFNAYNQYYVTITNTNQYVYRGNITFSLTRYDDNTEKNPKVIDDNTPISTKIDYVEDVDYYTFTNLGGVYDIYSTGYGTGNIDMKSELYLCNSSDCTSNIKITENDNYNSYEPISKTINSTKIISSKLSQKPEMGIYDFGYRINIGYNDGKTYLIKVTHSNDTQKGPYQLHMDHSKYLNSTIDKSSIISNVINKSEQYGRHISEVTGYLYHDNDEVFYKVDITRDSANIDLFLNVPSGVDYNLYLYDSNKNLINTSTKGNG